MELSAWNLRHLLSRSSVYYYFICLKTLKEAQHWPGSDHRLKYLDTIIDVQKETSDSLKINRVCCREKLFTPQTTVSCLHRHTAYFDDMLELTAGGGNWATSFFLFKFEKTTPFYCRCVASRGSNHIIYTFTDLIQAKYSG